MRTVFDGKGFEFVRSRGRIVENVGFSTVIDRVSVVMNPPAGKGALHQ